MNQKFLTVVLHFLFLFFVVGLSAEPTKPKLTDSTTPVLQRTVDKNILRKLIVETGYKILSDEEKLIILSYQDFKVGLMISNDTSIQFYSSFLYDKQNKMNLTNKWNQKMRYSRSYLDSEDRLILESDFDLSGGVSEDAIKEFLQKFQRLNTQFNSLLILAD